jgi:hypothetical protein
VDKKTQIHFISLANFAVLILIEIFKIDKIQLNQTATKEIEEVTERICKAGLTCDVTTKDNRILIFTLLI